MAKSTSNIRAGKAFVELSANDAKLRKALERAQRQLHVFGRGVANIGMGMARMGAWATAGLGAMMAPLGVAVNEASDLNETINAFNNTFGRIADTSRQTFEQIASDLGRPRKEILATASAFQSFFQGLGFGAGEAAKMSEQLTRLGLDLASMRNMSDAEASQRMLSAMSGSAEVLMPFGVNTMMGMLNPKMQAMGIDPAKATEAEKALARLAIIQETFTKNGVTGAAVRENNEFASVMKRIRTGAMELAAAIGEPLLEPLAAIGARLAAAANFAATWTRENAELVRSVVKLGLLALAGATALTALGLAVAGIGFVFIGIGGAIVGVMALLGALKVAFLAILSPLGLVTGAVLGAGAAFLTMTDMGRSAVAYLMDRFGALGDWFGQVWGGIVDAMAAGDLGLAAEVAMGGVRVAWEKGTLELRKIWEGLKASLFKTWESVTHGLLVGWEVLQHGMKVSWISTVHFLKTAWSDLSTSVKSLWESMWAHYTRGWLRAMAKVGHITDEEAEIAIAQEDRMSEGRLAEIGQQNIDLHNQADREKQAGLSRSRNQRDSNLLAIGIAYQEALNAIDRAAAEKIGAAQGELDEARKKLDDAIRRAAKARGAMPEDEGGGMDDRFSDAISAIQRTVASAAISVGGTFNASRIEQAFPGRHRDPAEEIKRLLQQTLPQIASNISSGATFGA